MLEAIMKINIIVYNRGYFYKKTADKESSSIFNSSCKG